MAINTPENEFVANYFVNLRRYTEWCLCLLRLKVGSGLVEILCRSPSY